MIAVEPIVHLSGGESTLLGTWSIITTLIDQGHAVRVTAGVLTIDPAPANPDLFDCLAVQVGDVEAVLRHLEADHAH